MSVQSSSFSPATDRRLNHSVLACPASSSFCCISNLERSWKSLGFWSLLLLRWLRASFFRSETRLFFSSRRARNQISKDCHSLRSSCEGVAFGGGGGVGFASGVAFAGVCDVCLGGCGVCLTWAVVEAALALFRRFMCAGYEVRRSWYVACPPRCSRRYRELDHSDRRLRPYWVRRTYRLDRDWPISRVHVLEVGMLTKGRFLFASRP